MTTDQINTIVTTCRTVAGASAIVWLYGSRLDDTRHGGDIDLLIEPQEIVNLLLECTHQNQAGTYAQPPC